MPEPMSDPRLNAILESVSRDEVISLAQALVRHPSITGREGLEISRFMANWLEQNGLAAGIQEVGPERANVYARLEGGLGPRVLLNGHLDTKPGDNMTIDPFGGEIKDGRLYGRGSCDMKGPVAAEMIATAAIARSGVKLNGILLFGSEVGEDGGGWKFEELIAGPCACDIGICGEPTNLELHLGCRGGFPLRIRAIGRATHTGTAYTGINAIEKICKVIPALYALPCFHRVDPLWGRSPINAMVIQGGGKVSSSVPDECVVQFDIRLNPDLPPDEVEAAIDAELARLQEADPELKLEIEKGRKIPTQVWPGRPAVYLPADDPLVATVRDAVAEATGEAPRLAGFPGGCSTGIMLRQGIKSLIYGPGDLRQAHSADEWVDLDQLHQAARAYAAPIPPIKLKIRTRYEVWRSLGLLLYTAKGTTLFGGESGGGWSRARTDCARSRSGPTPSRFPSKQLEILGGDGYVSVDQDGRAAGGWAGIAVADGAGDARLCRWGWG